MSFDARRSKLKMCIRDRGEQSGIYSVMLQKSGAGWGLRLLSLIHILSSILRLHHPDRFSLSGSGFPMPS